MKKDKNTPISIKLTQTTDASRLLNLWQTSLWEPKILIAQGEEQDLNLATEKQNIADHRRGNNLYLTAWQEKQIVGALKFTGGQYKSTKHSGRFEVFVRSESRRQGIASRLITELKTWAKQNEIKRIELEVFANNQSAIELYKKSGFKIDGKKIRAYKVSGRYVDSIIMSFLVI